MAATIAQSLSSLLQQSTLADHEELLKAANNSLKKAKGDVEAQHVRLVALIKLDRYEDALREVQEGGEALKQKAPLECAYALYKSGRLTEAEQMVARQTPRGQRHLAAQVAYRAEKFEDAAQLFKGLAGREADDEGEESDLRINSGATDAQLGWVGKGHLVTKKKPAREDLEQFEMAFNVACGYIARGELRQAEVLLGRATGELTGGRARFVHLLTYPQHCARLRMSFLQATRIPSYSLSQSSKSTFSLALGRSLRLRSSVRIWTSLGG